MDPAVDLAGRVVAVTGAARGIGQALAGAARARGATIVALDRDAPVRRPWPPGSADRPMPSTWAMRRLSPPFSRGSSAEIGPIALYCSNAGILERDPDPDLATSADPESWARSWAVT